MLAVTECRHEVSNVFTVGMNRNHREHAKEKKLYLKQIVRWSANDIHSNENLINQIAV